MKTNALKYIYLLLIVLLALLLRIPGVFWGQIDHPTYDVWEPDEYQHLEIARHQIHQIDSSYFNKKEFKHIWNTRSYGRQLGVVTYFVKTLGFPVVKRGKIIFIGRLLSCFYAVLLILLVYLVANIIFEDHRIALLSSLLMSIFDLNITYSHYALPAISYVFWTYLSIFFSILFYKYHKQNCIWKKWWLLFFFPLPFAVTLATKLDFLPIIVYGSLLLFLYFKKEIKMSSIVLLGVWFILGGLFFYWCAHIFNWSFDELSHSFSVAQAENSNVIAQDQHWIHNPLLYLMATICGTSLPVCIIAILGIFNLSESRKSKDEWIPYAIILLFLILEFLVRWQMDTPFVRRANIFLPSCAILAAYGFYALFKEKKTLRIVVMIFSVAYTLGISINSQSNFWKDNRYKAVHFLQNLNLEGKKIKYSVYAEAKGMPKETTSSFEKSDLIVIHETYYGRYWKYFSTPFKVPECCEEVYHCADKKTCSFFQGLLSNELEFKRIAFYPVKEFFPERLLFKNWFGTYETFLGDVAIYEKNNYSKMDN